MAEADLDRRKTSMAGTLPAVACLMEVQLDRCTARLTTKESRRSENTLRGGETVPIKWSALRVSEAMDMVEEFVTQAAGPLEQAKTVANEARNIANLPQYLDQRLVRLIIDIERIDYVRNSIKAVRNDLPNTVVEAEKIVESHGRQPVLVS